MISLLQSNLSSPQCSHWLLESLGRNPASLTAVLSDSKPWSCPQRFLASDKEGYHFRCHIQRIFHHLFFLCHQKTEVRTEVSFWVIYFFKLHFRVKILVPSRSYYFLKMKCHEYWQNIVHEQMSNDVFFLWWEDLFLMSLFFQHLSLRKKAHSHRMT